MRPMFRSGFKKRNDRNLMFESTASGCATVSYRENQCDKKDPDYQLQQDDSLFRSFSGASFHTAFEQIRGSRAEQVDDLRDPEWTRVLSGSSSAWPDKEEYRHSFQQKSVRSLETIAC